MLAIAREDYKEKLQDWTFKSFVGTEDIRSVTTELLSTLMSNFSSLPLDKQPNPGPVRQKRRFYFVKKTQGYFVNFYNVMQEQRFSWQFTRYFSSHKAKVYEQAKKVKLATEGLFLLA